MQIPSRSKVASGASVRERVDEAPGVSGRVPDRSKGELQMKLIIRWIITSFSLFVAAWLVPGIRVDREAWTVFGVMAVILGLVNAVVRPVLKLLSCPLIILTLGVFVLVINGLTLWLASALAVRWFHVGFHVDGFWPAFLGALIVSLVSIILTGLTREDRSESKK
jgi:putative membrane protein